VIGRFELLGDLSDLVGEIRVALLNGFQNFAVLVSFHSG
jgi:hypothetical protein